MTGQASDLENLMGTVFQGSMALPDGARVEGLAVEVKDGGGVHVRAGIVYLPAGSRFLGTQFPRGGSVTFENGQATLKQSAI